MKILNRLEQKQNILSKQVDFNLNLRFDEILGIFQDITTTHSKLMGVDYENMLKNSNAYWVLSKMKFKLDGLFKSGDEIVAITWPLAPSTFRFIRDYKILGEKGEILGRSEWCVLDAITLRLRKLDSVCYPKELEHLNNAVDLTEFTRFTEEFSIEDYLTEYKAVFTDIDCNKHVNNLSYAKMALNTFSLEEFESFNFNAFEIHFISQTFFEDKIKLYKKVFDDRVCVLGEKNEKPVFKALFYKE
ncbi:MAG: hypothetical protein E7342_02245 [Clostridiales bacterium]|nr:hypothetical protein [Clostridiales bacterium]